MPDFPYVLKVGGKNPTLVKVLHLWFDWLGFPPPAPNKSWQSLGGTYTEKTKQAVIQYQTWRQISPADGIVRAREWSELGKQIGYRAFDRKVYDCLYENNGCQPDTLNFIRNIGGYNGNSLSGGIHVYGPMFMSMYFQEFGGIDSTTFDGLGAFLDFMRTDDNLTDVRHAAYMMATAYKETFYTWRPVKEKNGENMWYGKLVTVECGGVKYTNRYYGRGYVQLTRAGDDKNNGGLYHDVSMKMNMGCELVEHPDRALEPELAYKILSHGMKDGWYRNNEKLSNYISGNTCNYYDARNIVNSAHDRATEIEGYAKTFEAMLRATMFR